jgi:hypothetical protein
VDSFHHLLHKLRHDLLRILKHNIDRRLGLDRRGLDSLNHGGNCLLAEASAAVGDRELA